MKKRGISPLIAAVLLIGFTMAIAGIMASWATQFSKGKLEKAGESSECIGAIGLNSLKFDNVTVSVKITNNKNINLTGLKASFEYDNPLKSRNYTDILLSNYSVSDPLGSQASAWFIYNTSDTTKPKRITVYSQNCGPDKSEELSFP